MLFRSRCFEALETSSSSPFSVRGISRIHVCQTRFALPKVCRMHACMCMQTGMHASSGSTISDASDAFRWAGGTSASAHRRDVLRSPVSLENVHVHICLGGTSKRTMYPWIRTVRWRSREQLEQELYLEQMIQEVFS